MAVALTASTSNAANHVCFVPASGEKLVEKLSLNTPAGQLSAVSIMKSDHAAPWGYSARIMIYGADCQVIYERDFPKSMEVRFDRSKFEALPVLVATAVAPGVSESGYEHVILTYGAKVHPLLAAAPMTGDTGGFYIGDLGRGRGPGLAVWQAVWADDEGHYGAHRFEFIIYSWRAGRFDPPQRFTTSQKLKMDVDGAARSQGFSFHDLTAGALLRDEPDHV
jgi:hypothetical protein